MVRYAEENLRAKKVDTDNINTEEKEQVRSEPRADKQWVQPEVMCQTSVLEEGSEVVFQQVR